MRTRFFVEAIYDLINGVGAPLDGAEVGLFTNDPDLDEDTVIGDLDQPTFTGYAVAAATFADAAGAGGESILAADPSVFSPTDAVGLPQLIRGAFLIDAGGDLLLAAKFANPIALTAAAQQLHVTAKVDLNSTEPLTLEAGLA